jgi:hypothetical protein
MKCFVTHFKAENNSQRWKLNIEGQIFVKTDHKEPLTLWW